MSAVRNAWNVLRAEGPYATLARTIRRLVPYNPSTVSLVPYDDALAVDWSTPHPAVVEMRRIDAASPTIAWVMSPPGTNSGGHQNLFRFIRVLQDAGFRNRVYLTSTVDDQDPEEVRSRVQASSSYADVDATIERYPGAGVPADVDVIIATGWETAYRSYRDSSPARRLYFVQDFEPAFYPISAGSQLAENTYRFGFTGLTAGGWLADRLHREFGMTTYPFDFGADASHYSVRRESGRDAIFFYARPETPRRGFELGVMALDLFHRDHPECRIILAGQNLRGVDLPFPFEAAGNLQVGQLNDVYNQCSAALVLSLTNMSLLPLELLAAGVIPVVNDAPNNRMVSENPFISFAQPSPRALATALSAAVSAADEPGHARRAAASVQDHGWDRAATQFLAAMDKALS